MKKQILYFAIAMLSFSAAAASNIQNTEAEAGAEVMIRQVLDHKLLGPKAMNVYADLTRAMEGSGNSKASNTLESILCDAGLGSLYCDIVVSGVAQTSNGDAAYSYTVTPRLYQGKVISARLGVDVKRSQPVIWEMPHEMNIGDACPAQSKQYDDVAFEIGKHGGYVCFTCDFKDQDLVVKTQSRCSNAIGCESGVCQ